MPGLIRFATAGMLGATALLLAQGPAFEVASVRLARPVAPAVSTFGDLHELFRISGNRVTASAPLTLLIAASYDLKAYQVMAGPAWAASEEYGIIAKAEGDAPTSASQARSMVQTLLADRFQLTMHREVRDLAVYHLVAAKGGFKLKPSPAGTQPSLRVSARPPMGAIGIRQSLGDILRILSNLVDRPVVDKTGLTGEYDFRLELSTEGLTSADDFLRMQVLAIQEQFGLKLESARESTQVFVIDRAERPSPD